MWARRIKETFAIITIGDGVIELISPRVHSLLWEFGSTQTRHVARFFADNPNLMRLPGVLQVAFGWRSASTANDSRQAVAGLTRR